jgi:uncharacterized protein YlzI (FlbEa/FlbD family)
MRLVKLTAPNGLPFWVNPDAVAYIRPAPHDQTAIYFVNDHESQWAKEPPEEVVRLLTAPSRHAPALFERSESGVAVRWLGYEGERVDGG